MLAARLFDQAAVGLAGALISAMIMSSLVCNLGITSTFIERLPRAADNNAWSRIVTAGLVAATAATILGATVTAVVLPLVSDRTEVLHTWTGATLFVGGAAVWTVGMLLDYTYIAQRAGSNMFLRNTAFSVLKIPLLFLPVLLATRTDRTALGIFASWVEGAALSAILGFALLGRLGRHYQPIFAGITQELRGMLRSLAGHHLANLGAQLPAYLLPLVIVTQLSTEDNAFFYLTWMVGAIFFFVSPAVASSLFAEGSHEQVGLEAKVRQSALIIAAILSAPMAGVLATGGLVLRIFGADYPSHGRLLLVYLVLSAVPDACTNLAVAVLRVRGRLRLAAALNLGMSVVAIGLAIVLVPDQGIAGAGLAWLLAQSFGAMVVLVGWFRGRRS